MAYKRLLTGLFICLCSFLLMSHNTFATELDIPVRLYTTSGYLRASYLYGNTTTNVSGAFNNAVIANQIRLYYASMAVFDGLYLDVPVYVYNYNENNSVDGYMNINSVSCNNGAIACQLAGFSYSGSGTGQVYHAIIYVSGSGNLSDVQLYTTLANQYALRLYDSERAQPLPLTAYRLVDNSTDMSNVNTYIQYISNQLDTIFQRLGVMNNNIPSADDIADAVNDAQKEETQDAADASSNAGSSAVSSSQQATSSLLSTITGFFNAIISVNPSNCKFNSNLPFLPGNGEIDLCSISTPPIVQTLSSLVLVGLFIPFCIHMFNRFVSITESFQR